MADFDKLMDRKGEIINFIEVKAKALNKRNFAVKDLNNISM